MLVKVSEKLDASFFSVNEFVSCECGNDFEEEVYRLYNMMKRTTKVWLSKSLRKDTKIRIFNACVKSVLLYGCETWLVTNEIQRKIQTFVNRCLRYILRIWWPNIISNKDLWKATGQEDINLEIRKRKF